MQPKKTLITNAKVICPGRIVKKDILVEGVKIARIANKIPRRGLKVINGRGRFLSPGFIDLHIHGRPKKISSNVTKQGTTSFLATSYFKDLTSLKDYLKELENSSIEGAYPLGLRLEGPYINKEMAGALPRACIKSTDLNQLKAIIKESAGSLKMMTVAPEIKGGLETLKLLRKSNVIASLGHTRATFRQAKLAFDRGARHVTHVFNRMPDILHNQPGSSLASLLDERIVLEAIIDGVHLSPEIVKLIVRCKGLNKLILVSDSVRARPFPGTRKKSSVFYFPDGRLAGTALPLNQALKNLIKFTNISLASALKTVTINPAKLLKISRVTGSIDVGQRADLVIFDNNLNVTLTLVKGKVVYRKRGFCWKRVDEFSVYIIFRFHFIFTGKEILYHSKVIK